MNKNLDDLSRKELQRLAKKHDVKANLSNDELRSALASCTKRKAVNDGDGDGESSSRAAKMVKLDEQEEKEALKEEKEQSPDLKPYANCRFVVTGVFPISSEMIERGVRALGGVVVNAVTKSTTHIMLGDSDTTAYGGKTGVGSKKYKDAKKQKCVVVKYEDLQQAEMKASVARDEAGEKDGVGKKKGVETSYVNPLQQNWDALLAVIEKGVALEVWPAPSINPPASMEAIALLEADLKFRIGGYADLLLLADGMHFYGGGAGVCFGGTGEDEDDILSAFDYSGDYGRKQYRRNKQVPMAMIDYDFCVEVYEVKSGRVMQDDRECGSYHRVASSLKAWLKSQVKELEAAISTAVAKKQDEGSSA